jgi:hypothetical protein
MRALVLTCSSFIYIGLLHRSIETIDPCLPATALLFVVSLFYGYFTHHPPGKGAEKDAEKRNEGRREMLNIVSHASPPLNVIGGYAEALKNGMFSDINQQGRGRKINAIGKPAIPGE